MSNKYHMSVTLILALVTLVGCGKEEAAPVVEAIHSVKTVVIDAPSEGGIRQFPGRIDANRKADLAFRVSGTVNNITVKEGDRVQEGQVIARLDPTDYQIIANDRQASFDVAKANYERGKALVEKGTISKMDFDKLEGQYKSTRAALERAKQDLSYTTLRAPFTGDIARRHIQTFEQVQAKQAVMTLNDTSVLEVKFDVPENIMLSLSRTGIPREERRQKVAVTASFETLPGKRFELTFKETATKADPKTQTFEATFTMPRPEGVVVLPGMTVTVTVDLSRLIGSQTIFLLPVSAVVADTGLQGTAWVVDMESMTVNPRQVTVSKMLGNSIEVTGGLEPGDRVVIAGVPYLVEGMKVRVLPEREEAEPDNLNRAQ